jgi:hypothetical protein
VLRTTVGCCVHSTRRSATDVLRIGSATAWVPHRIGPA